MDFGRKGAVMRILALSGFVPEHICDIVRFTGFDGEYNIAQYCGYAADYISQVIKDDSIDGAVFPKSCDSSRIIGSYLSETNKFIYQINIPARQDDLAIQYFAEILKSYTKALKEHYKVSLTTESIERRIELINKRNAWIKAAYDRLDRISYYEYLSKIHQLLSEPLEIQAEEIEFVETETTDKKVYVVGSFLANVEIAETIERLGMKVVGDNLPESGRLAFMKPVCPNGDDIYNCIADSILKNRLSPTQDNFSAILENDFSEMENKGVKGIIYISQKYCEPYDYLFSVYKKMADARGINIVRISLADSKDSGKSELELEAFSDLL